jgi:hypothetical protein
MVHPWQPPRPDRVASTLTRGVGLLSRRWGGVLRSRGDRIPPRHLTPELAREWGDALIVIETLSTLVVDAEGITFFGTAGLEALERADRPKGFVLLRRPSSSVRRLLTESNATSALTTE